MAQPGGPGGARAIRRAVAMENGGLILLVFLAFLFAWGLNRFRKMIRLGPVAYAGVMITFVIVILALYTQTQR
ncbi:hypothetical protein ACWEN6_32755 [Sphaerisporangium sp. NPDC004334]